MALILREASEGDCPLLFHWANNYEVRKNALNPQKITRRQHEAWFQKKMSSPNSKIFILVNGNFPIGQIRYDRKKGCFWEIDFSIDKKFRGMGFGKKIIELSLNNISGTVRALVKRENYASCRIFEKLGFQKEKSEGETIQYIFK